MVDSCHCVKASNISHLTGFWSITRGVWNPERRTLCHGYSIHGHFDLRKISSQQCSMQSRLGRWMSALPDVCSPHVWCTPLHHTTTSTKPCNHKLKTRKTSLQPAQRTLKPSDATTSSKQGKLLCNLLSLVFLPLTGSFDEPCPGACRCGPVVDTLPCLVIFLSGSAPVHLRLALLVQSKSDLLSLPCSLPLEKLFQQLRTLRRSLALKGACCSAWCVSPGLLWICNPCILAVL